MENNTQNNTLSEDNKDHITPDNEEHLDRIESPGGAERHVSEGHISTIDIKYLAVVFILLCGGNIVELDEFIYKTSDEFMGNYMIDELEFVPVLGGGFMDQEIGHDRYAETFYAVLKNSSIITNLDELDLDNFTISDLISKKIIKMISFTIYP